MRIPAAVICHGPWIFVEIDVVRGRTLTSHPSIRTDLRNAGANWVDAEVHVDDRLVSSRTPADLVREESVQLAQRSSSARRNRM